MPTPCGNIINGYEWNCDLAIVGGSEQEFEIMNRSSIDRTNTVIDRTDTTHKITHLQLLAGEVSYPIVCSTSKKHVGFTSVFNRNEESNDDYTHTANFRVYDLAEETLTFLKQLGRGADLVIVSKMKDIGTAGETKYMVWGFDAGLKLTEMNINTLENKGATPLVLSSVDDMEPHIPMIYFDTDLATSDTAYDAHFA